jgi:CdiI immunity protein
MNDHNVEFLDLRYLLGYFHQAWAKSYNWSGHEISFEPVVRYFKIDNPELSTSKAIKDLEQLLALNLNEEKLEEIIDDFTTSGYSPLETHQEFLEKILHVLAEPVEQSKLEFIPNYIS